MSAGFVADEFTGQIQALQQAAAGAAAVVTQGGQRPWSYPTPGGWGGAPYDVAGMEQAFSRAEIDAGYSAVVLDPAAGGTVGDAIALAVQNDYLAARERAFRVRHASPVRAACHSAARRAGQGQAGGVFGNGVLRYVQDTLRQGGGG